MQFGSRAIIDWEIVHRLMSKAEIKMSKGGEGRCVDNIIIEKWFCSVTHEETYPSEYKSENSEKNPIQGL